MRIAESGANEGANFQLGHNPISDPSSHYSTAVQVEVFRIKEIFRRNLCIAHNTHGISYNALNKSAAIMTRFQMQLYHSGATFLRKHR